MEAPDYTLEEDDKADRGTEVTLFISKEEKEFLEDYKIRELLKKILQLFAGADTVRN